MKVVIGNGTPVECSSIDVDGPVLKAWAKKSPVPRASSILVLAYHLHPGEKVMGRMVDGEEVYEVNQ